MAGERHKRRGDAWPVGVPGRALRRHRHGGRDHGVSVGHLPSHPHQSHPHTLTSHILTPSPVTPSHSHQSHPITLTSYILILPAFSSLPHLSLPPTHLTFQPSHPLIFPRLPPSLSAVSFFTVLPRILEWLPLLTPNPCRETGMGLGLMSTSAHWR